MEICHHAHFWRETSQFFSMMTTFQVYFYFFLTFAKKSPIRSPYTCVIYFFGTFRKNCTMNRGKASANLNSRKKKHECDHCGLEFTTKHRLQQHLKTSKNCQKELPFSCDFCDYVGLSEYGLQRHHFSSPQCLHFVNESKVLTGVLPDMHVAPTNYRTANPGTSAYQYNRYFLIVLKC